MIPNGWLLKALFGDNMNLLRFGGISDMLRGTILVSVSGQEKQHSSRLDQNNLFTSAHPAGSDHRDSGKALSPIQAGRSDGDGATC